MTITERIMAFCNLGEKITNHLKGDKNDLLQESIDKSIINNTWFTNDFINFSLRSIASFLQKEKLEKWIAKYPLKTEDSAPKKIAVIMAGNIPVVGFHDFLCVLISGNIFIGKLSSKDQFLLPALAKILIESDSRLKDCIKFTEARLSEFDAVIATGSDNTSRYFQYYFGKHPNIIRKNRKSIAILSGDETPQDLDKLADDVFLYFGLGCRNVSKLYIPKDYDFSLLIQAFQKYKHLSQNTKYANNLEYNKAVLIINKKPFIDAGFFLLNETTELSSPVSVINFEKYDSVPVLNNIIELNKESLQCVISKNPQIVQAIGFGKAQTPEIYDYADGVDTMEFLVGNL